MRKIFLVPICVMMCVSFSSCSDNKVDSLNQALSLQGDYINNTIELINSNYQKGFFRYQIRYWYISDWKSRRGEIKSINSG